MRVALTILAVLTAAGCASAQTSATPATTTISVPATDRSAPDTPPTTPAPAAVDVDADVAETTVDDDPRANLPVPAGQEDFDEIYRHLDAIRGLAYETSDTELFDTVADLPETRTRLAERANLQQGIAGSDDYRIDSVLDALRPADDIAVLVVTDTSSEGAEPVDLNTGATIETSEGRDEPTRHFLVTLNRDTDGIWIIVDDIRVDDSVLDMLTGPRDDVGTVTANGMDMTMIRIDKQSYCLITHQPVAMLCTHQDTYFDWVYNPRQPDMIWQLWPSDRGDVLIVAASKAAAPTIDGNPIETAPILPGIHVTAYALAPFGSRLGFEGIDADDGSFVVEWENLPAN